MHGMDNMQVIKVRYKAFCSLQAHVVRPTNVLVREFTPNKFVMSFSFLIFQPHLLR